MVLPLAETPLKVIKSGGGVGGGGGNEIALNPAPRVLLSLGYIQIGSEPYKSAWLNIKPSKGKYEGYEVIENEGIPQLYVSDFEANTQTAISSTNTAVRLRLLQFLLDGNMNTPIIY